MKQGLSVIIKETGKGAKALKTTLANLRQAGSYVRVGVLSTGKGSGTHAVGRLGPRKVKSKLTLAEIAVVHEFGSSNGRIPQRSFMRASFYKHRSEYVDIMRGLVGLIVDQKITVPVALKRLGARMVSDMQKYISTGEVTPPNAQSTIDAKNASRRKRRGHRRTKRSKSKAKTTPLIDTGLLLRAISYDVTVITGSAQRSSVLGVVL